MTAVAHRLPLPRPFLMCALMAAACGDGPTVPLDDPPPQPTAPARPEALAPPLDVRPTTQADDLQILYIQRTPEMDYVWNSPDPARDGWPSVGQTVTWVARVYNAANVDRDSVGYRWTEDDSLVAEGTVDLAAGATADIPLPWTWIFDRHVLAFELDPADEFAEEDRNNRVALFTDALSIGFYVEQRVHDYFAAHQHELSIGSNSFEDWAHRQVRLWNEMLEKARYPETPTGVLDRVRLDRVHVVADGALPLDPTPVPFGDFDSTQARPNIHDRTVDLQWGFPAWLVDGGVFSNHTSLNLSNQFYFSGFVQHELGHARYLVDVYGWDVHSGTAGDQIDIEEDGRPVPGSKWMPGRRVVSNGDPGIRVYSTVEKGLMSVDWAFMDRYSAVAWNLIAGERAVSGNYNSPENVGAFLNDLPARNTLTLVDRGNRVRLAGAQVDIYRADPSPTVGPASEPYRHIFDGQSDMTLTANGQGEVELGRNPFGGSDPIVLDDFTNGVIIVRVELDGRVGYGFLESTAFNLAYWRGETDRASHVLYVDMF